MMVAVEVLLLAVSIGVECGVWTKTGPLWCAGRVSRTGACSGPPYAAFLGSRIALALFSLCAVGELIAD